MTVASVLRKKRRNLQSDRKARLHQLYSSDDVIKLYEISRNTLTNWVAEGLPFVNANPRLFRGSDLNAFHAARKKKNSDQLRGKFWVNCFGCKGSHSLLGGEISIVSGRTDGVFRVYKICPDTGVRANKYVCSGELQTLHEHRATNPGSETPD